MLSDKMIKRYLYYYEKSNNKKKKLKAISMLKRDNNQFGWDRLSKMIKMYEQATKMKYASSLKCKITINGVTTYCNKCTSPNIRNKSWYCPTYRLHLVVEGKWLTNKKGVV